MAEAVSPRRVVADVDALDAADDETGPAATIAALKSLQRQIGCLDRDRYGALSRAALLRQEIGELERSLEQLAGAARAERAHVDVRGATAAGLEACEREEKAAAALEDDPPPRTPRPRGVTPPPPPSRASRRRSRSRSRPRRAAAAAYDY
ncbi:hypothetical protein JL722_5065 [Aureococcus anophagefferens]|nr:hypothetical protein JL722_5065 [Aureococcus anophagefferens]